MSAEPQTQSRIKRLLGARGLNPRRDLGQNFLIDLNLVRFVAEQAELSERDVVLEVGPGMGSLTGALAPVAGAVIAVEYDRNLYDIAGTTLAGLTNVTLINRDILQGKHAIAPPVMEAVRAEQAKSADRRFKLVANLPYNVATPVISNIVASGLRWERMVVTIQYELAERMLAAPSSADYSALSVWLQSQCDIEILRKLPPSVFWPRPNVDSAIVKITPNAAKCGRIKDRAFFHDYLRSAFQQRRKQLRGLLAGISPAIDKPAAARLLSELGCGDNVRAEELEVPTHVELSNRIQNLHRDAAGI